MINTETLKKRIFSPEGLAGTFIAISFLIKLGMILYYGSAFTLGSDDEKYIRSARILAERLTFVYNNVNEPTVFITPVFPMFAAAFFKIFGPGFIGLQAVRIAQAVLSSITLLYLYLIGKKIFNENIAVIAVFLMAFYPPNITAVGFFLTETLFTLLLYMLVYHYVSALEQEKLMPYVLCGVIWGIAALCRPTIALLPGAFVFYDLFIRRTDFRRVFRTGAAMALAFIVVMSPWWVRNFLVLGEFIPLAESSGNPMLQGTYINYDQSNPTIYKMQDTERKQNQEEMRVAILRIRQEFKDNFRDYLRWYTIGKTYLLWRDPFYWREFMGIRTAGVKTIHHFMLFGFLGLLVSLIKDFRKYSLYFLILLYFNAIYCVYMTFDRYAFPFIPMISVFLAYIIVLLAGSAKKGLITAYGRLKAAFR